jgi:hypothetical protein
MAYLDEKGLSHLVSKLKSSTITIDSALSSTSTNPVQNKVVNTALNGKASVTHTHSVKINGLTKRISSSTTVDLGSYALSAHSHNITSLGNVSVTLKDVTTGGWEVIGSDYSTGTWLRVVKGAEKAPAWYAPKYASGLAFGVGDIKGVLSLSNSLAKVCFASGGTAQGTPSWYFTLTGTKEEEYNLDNIPTGKMPAQAELSSSASLTTVINKVNAIIKALKTAGIMNS